MKKKDMDYFDARAKHKLIPFGDADRDGVKNIVDCKPYDPNRDGVFGRIAYAATGGRYGQSRDEYEAERRNRSLIREQHRVERREQRAKEREAYRESFREARVERAKLRGKQAGSMTMGDRFSNAAGNIRIKPYSTRNNYNPFGSMFDTGVHNPKKKTSGSQKYAVVGGKAYPIAGDKKKKTGKKSSSRCGGFDITDNWGFMK